MIKPYTVTVITFTLILTLILTLVFAFRYYTRIYLTSLPSSSSFSKKVREICEANDSNHSQLDPSEFTSYRLNVEEEDSEDVAYQKGYDFECKRYYYPRCIRLNSKEDKHCFDTSEDVERANAKTNCENVAFTEENDITNGVTKNSTNLWHRLGAYATHGRVQFCNDIADV